MEDFLQILQIIVNISVILIFVTIVILLLKISKLFNSLMIKIDFISKDVNEIKPKVSSAFEKIGALAESVTEVTGKINENIEVLGTVVEKIKDTTESVIEFEQKIQNAIEPPVMETINTVTAVTVGIKTFVDSLKRNKRNSD